MSVITFLATSSSLRKNKHGGNLGNTLFDGLTHTCGLLVIQELSW